MNPKLSTFPCTKDKELPGLPHRCPGCFDPPLQNIPPLTDPVEMRKLRKALGIEQLDLFRGQRDMFRGLDNILDRELVQNGAGGEVMPDTARAPGRRIGVMP